MLAFIHIYIQWIVGIIFIILYCVTILGLVVVIIAENRNPLKTIPWVIVFLGKTTENGGSSLGEPTNVS